ncbi:MAG: MmcQ/YjbR family DNA-binding protein [Bacteroidales bacterium]|nr:MmcQ/YjbR family DNA-binding protein [Bacteroidales bacterium]
MNIEELREYCLAGKEVTETFPFDETTLVFKVMNKMFALTDLEEELKVNIKCPPEKAIELRERYPDTVFPGYHMDKRHWNTVFFNREVDDQTIREWIDESYELVVSSLPKYKQREIWGE